MDIYNKLLPIVRFTGKKGFDEAAESREDLHKWLYIWAGDIGGEIQEALSVEGASFDDEEIHPDVLGEIGDVMWGITAVSELLQLEGRQDIWLLPCGSEKGSDVRDARDLAVLFWGECKKYCRDWQARDIDKDYVEKTLTRIAFILGSWYTSKELETAADMVVDKLKKRYPHGFSAQASVERKV